MRLGAEVGQQEVFGRESRAGERLVRRLQRGRGGQAEQERSEERAEDGRSLRKRAC